MVNFQNSSKQRQNQTCVQGASSIDSAVPWSLLDGGAE